MTSARIIARPAEKTGQTASEVLDNALDAYRRQVFFDKLNSGYAQLRADPQAWDEFQADHMEWEDAPLDNLAADERWTEDGQCADNNAG